MTIQSIFLFAPAESAQPHCGAPAYAIGLAKAYGASLTVFCVALDVTTPGRQADAPGTANAIAAAALAAGVECRTLTEHSHAIGIHEVLAEHARIHDLVVIGVNRTGLLSERHVAEYLMFESGRPLVLVPPACDSGEKPVRVAAAWDNTAAAARALGDASALLAVPDLVLVTIDGEKQVQGDLDSDALVAAAARRGISARHILAELGNRTMAAALQDEALAHGASLLVMGAFGHSRMRRFVLGSATSDLMQNIRMPVLVSH
jgi:nucleotide-binding universal stress UspA family protein